MPINHGPGQLVVPIKYGPGPDAGGGVHGATFPAAATQQVHSDLHGRVHSGRKGITPVAFDRGAVEAMECLFEQCRTPTKGMLVELQVACGDDMDRIRKWFRDRRYKDRKYALRYPEQVGLMPGHTTSGAGPGHKKQKIEPFAGPVSAALQWLCTGSAVDDLLSL